MNPKIGTYNPERIDPTQTITGKPYERGDYDPPPAIVHGLGENHFAIGDPFAPRGFDLDAELDKLKAELAPKAAGIGKREPEAKAE